MLNIIDYIKLFFKRIIFNVINIENGKIVMIDGTPYSGSNIYALNKYIKEKTIYKIMKEEIEFHEAIYPTNIEPEDWEGEFDFLEEYCSVKYLPRTEGISSTKIKSLVK